MKRPPPAFDGPIPPPGSPPALANGCKCSPGTNRNGNGAGENFKGQLLYIIAAKCPLHKEEKPAA